MKTVNFVGLVLILNALLALPVFGQSSFIANLFATQQSGTGTYYGPTTGGNCGYGSLIPSFVSSLTQVAIQSSDYAGNNLSEGCGLCVQMKGTGTGSGASPISETPFIAFVQDQCPSCNANGIDIALSGDGAWGITWIAVPCPVGSSKIHYQLQGSNAYYLKLQVIGSSIPVTDVALVIGGSHYPTTRTQDNYWLNPSNAPTPFVFPLTVLLTAYNGATLTDTIPSDGSFTNSVLLSGSGVQFSTTAPPTAPPRAPTAPPTAPPRAPTAPPTSPPRAPTAPPTAPPKAPPTAPPKAPPTSGLICGDTGCSINSWWIEFQVPTSFTGTPPTAGTVLCSGTTNVPCTWYGPGSKYQCSPSSECLNPIPIWQGQQCPYPTPQALTADQSATSDGGLTSLPTAAIAGIVAGSVALVVGLIVTVIVVKKRTHREELV